MGYKKILDIPKAGRLEWSPEKGGRTRQKVAGSWVRKFSFSPYTAKAREVYSFYADIETIKEIESPTGLKGEPVKRRYVTILAYVGTFLEFRDAVLSGEVDERLQALVESQGGGGIADVGYWRNRGERRVEGGNP